MHQVYASKGNISHLQKRFNIFLDVIRITKNCRRKLLMLKSEFIFASTNTSFLSTAKLKEIVGGGKLFSLIRMMQKTFLVSCMNINGENIEKYI